MKIQLSILVLLLIIFVGLCTLFNSVKIQEPDIPQKILDVPPADYNRIIRFSDQNVFIAVDNLDNISQFYSLNEKRFLELSFPPDERCHLRPHYDLPSAFPNGRLGFRKLCSGFWPDRPIGQDGVSFVVAYDLTSQEFEQLVAPPLPYTAFDVTWNPEMTRGVQAFGSLLGSIYWVTPQGMEPITVTLSEGGKSWSLDENLAAIGHSDRIDVGIADRPAWSPDGRWVAFVASLEAIGREGLDRAEAKYNLYLLDPETLETKILLKETLDGRLTWSPDSQWLLIRDRIKSKDGLWLISLKGDPLYFIDTSSNGSFEGEAWLNNQTIIATKCVNLELVCSQAKVLEYDVSQITQK